MGEKRKLWTVGQIDATGIRGPHEKELEDISQTKYPLFIDRSNLEHLIFSTIYFCSFSSPKTCVGVVLTTYLVTYSSAKKVLKSPVILGARKELSW